MMVSTQNVVLADVCQSHVCRSVWHSGPLLLLTKLAATNNRPSLSQNGRQYEALVDKKRWARARETKKAECQVQFQANFLYFWAINAEKGNYSD
eukprot:scaffold282_cov129-Skeletonema_menzelii.AAC.4